MKRLILVLLFIPSIAFAQSTNVKIWDGTDIALVTAGKALQTDGSATTQPVSGTVTCNIGTGGPLATAANQVTEIGLLTTIDGDTGTLAGTVAGSEQQVDIVASLPAGTNLVGRVSSSDETTTIYEGTTSLTPKFAAIDAASSGDNTLVAGVAGKKIRVLNVVLIASAPVNVRFESDPSGTALTGQMNLTTNSGFAPGYVPVGHFQTADDDDLNLELSGAVSVDGWLTYVEVD